MNDNQQSIDGIDLPKPPPPKAAPAPKQAHHCHWPGCPITVPPKLWGCRDHWYKLPKAARDAIWATYRPGQEIDKNPSAEYIRVADMVQIWIKKNYFSLPGNPS